MGLVIILLILYILFRPKRKQDKNDDSISIEEMIIYDELFGDK